MQYGCSCCNASHAMAVLKAVRPILDDADLSKGCKEGLVNAACRICDPEVCWVWHKAVCGLQHCYLFVFIFICTTAVVSNTPAVGKRRFLCSKDRLCAVVGLLALGFRLFTTHAVSLFCHLHCPV